MEFFCWTLTVCGARQPPRHSPALPRLRHPAGEGAEVAERGCGGLRQAEMRGGKCPSKSCLLQNFTRI